MDENILKKDVKGIDYISIYRLLIRLPEEIYEAIRKAAFESKKSMTELVNEAIQQYLNERKNTPTN